ncbi:MAG: hypothetical protein ACI9U5_001571, partial [Colwellia sp.]
SAIIKHNDAISKEENKGYVSHNMVQKVSTFKDQLKLIYLGTVHTES